MSILFDSSCSVSVIIPTYNSQNTIDRAIKSVLNQTFGNFELLICDDASNDNTCHIVESYLLKYSKIRLFRLYKNSGAGAARNLGMQNATGKYISFLDSDDEWLPQKLEFQINALEAYKGAYKICICGANVYNTNGKLIKKYIPNIAWGKQSLKKFIIGKIPVLTPTIIFEKSLIQNIGLMIEQMRRGQDMEFLLRLLTLSDLLTVKENLANIYLELRVSNKQVYERQLNSFPFRTKHIPMIREKLGNYYSHYYSGRLQTSLLISAIREFKWYEAFFHLKRRLEVFPLFTYKDVVIFKAILLSVTRCLISFYSKRKRY